ncbi:MAG TPA: TonB-dependent receptor [Polyangiales bacterium]|nr:TonB-dependent receptor [Polyangiales bacterium]
MARGQEVSLPQLAEGQSSELQAEGQASGRVVMELTIDAQGAVEKAEVMSVEVEPADWDASGVVAEAEGRAWGLSFEPARRDGVAVAAKVRFEFRVVPAPAPAPAPESESAHGHVHQHPHVHVHQDQEPNHDAAEHAHAFGAHALLEGGAAEAEASAASDVDVEIGALRAVPRYAAQDYLTLAPGVVLVNHAGIGHAAGVFMRGFDAGEGQDIEFLVDGVPINEPSNAHGHGYADTQFLIPEVVERVRVLEGPFDPRQGDFAVAGSAAFELGVVERGIRAQVGYGAFAEKRGLLLWAPAGASRGTFAAVDLRQGDGFGPNRAHSSLSAMARYEGDSGSLRYSILATSHALDFDSAGVLRDDDYRAHELPCPKDADSQFFCVVDPQQGGAASRHMLDAQLEWRKPDRSYQLQVYGILRNLRLRENFTGALLDPRGDGLDEGYETGAVGMHSHYALTPEWLGRRQRLEIGLDARHDNGETRSWRLRSQTGIPYETVFDSEIALTHVAAYLRGELHPLPFLSLLGGARLDGYSFQTVDRAEPSEDRVGPRLPKAARDAFGYVISPRGSLVAHVLPVLDWTLSAGLGTRSSDALALSENEDAPFARVLSLETGPTLRQPLGEIGVLEARAFAFATRVDDDMLFDPKRGRNVPVGPSNRYGASASARARFGAQHDTLASVTWTEAHQISPGDSIFAFGEGPRLPFVPRWVARLDHASSLSFPIGSERLLLTAAAGIGWVGPQPLPLATESEARWQLDLAVRARLHWVELGLSVENLFDRRNRAAEFNYASHFGGEDEPVSMRNVRHFAAAPPRLWMLTLTGYFEDVFSSGDES